VDRSAASTGPGRIDPEFTAYPLRELAAAALECAAGLGAGHADFRAERITEQQVGLSDGQLETLFDAVDVGLAVRVVVDGTWGFAAAVDLTTEAAVSAAARAVEVARVAAALSTERIELAAEPAHGDVSWVSAYDQDPFGVSTAEKIALLGGWSSGLLASDRVDHVDASLLQVKECKFYCDGATTATQQRVRVHPELTAVAVAAGGRFETMRTLAPPADPGRPVGGRADRRRGARELRGRRQELVHRHAAVQLPVHRPALLQDLRRAAGTCPWPAPGSACSDPSRRPWAMRSIWPHPVAGSCTDTPSVR
jgi:predicted Zn-dependent protease